MVFYIDSENNIINSVLYNLRGLHVDKLVIIAPDKHATHDLYSACKQSIQGCVLSISIDEYRGDGVCIINNVLFIPLDIAIFGSKINGLRAKNVILYQSESMANARYQLAIAIMGLLES